jgi:OmcA/MtrC family decaheme c-type cytochrome
MRTPSSVFAVGRYALALVVVAASVLMVSGQNKTTFDAHDKAAYATQAMIQYVNPGLVFSVVSAKIATDGTITVDYKVTDPKGLALDTAGIQTPGTISNSFLAAYIPKGQAQYVSYTTRIATAATGGATATQAGADSGGTTQTVAVGEYIYTFKTKATTGFDATATHRVGIYGSRNLTVWDLGTNYASTTFDFVPAGGTPAPRDIVRTPDCNSCHDSLAFHGGSRKGVDLCIMCHTPQTTNPDTGNTVDMPVMTHAIHIGQSFPTIENAAKPYQIFSRGSLSDWQTVVYPADVRNCAKTCHNPKNGAAQTNAWLTTPTRAACGACHSSINFASGLNHVNLPQVDDKQCAGCHIPQGELEFDASIIGGHTIPAYSLTLPGINVTLVKVIGAAGAKPVVSFTVKDNSGAGIPMSKFTSGGSLSMSMTGSTSDYGSVSFGTDTASTPGYVTESVAAASQCDNGGNCTYTFTHAIPAAAKGTYAIGVEARLSATLLPGTTLQQTTNYSAHNPVIYFSVDGSKVAARRTVVAMANCNRCHVDLQLHGGLRNDVAYCPVCHNPANTDFTTRPTATTAADKALPPQGINFALMVHKIHTGDQMPAQFGTTYIIVGHGGSHNDFSDVRYPAMSPTGSVPDTTNCQMCHVAGTEDIPPVGKLAVTDPQGLLNPAPATTSACTACHQNTSAFAHAQSNTDPKFGESCDVCHGAAGQFAASKVHAGL